MHYFLPRETVGTQLSKKATAAIETVMSRMSPIPHILVTGSTGRLGTLLRLAWYRHMFSSINLCFTARQPMADLYLSGEGPLPDLPLADTILALWGDRAGQSCGEGTNTHLAQRTRAVARACHAKRVFHISSAAVYGSGSNLSEGHTPMPLNSYGQSKIEMEKIVLGFQGDHASHCCLRLANVVGADSLATALNSDRPLILDRFKNGRGPTRSYISPTHLLKVLIGLAHVSPDQLPKRLNVAAANPVEMAQLVAAARKHFNWRPAPVSAVQEVSLSTQKLCHLLPDINMQPSAADMIADWQSLRND